jgi:hypothetical protein
MYSTALTIFPPIPAIFLWVDCHRNVLVTVVTLRSSPHQVKFMLQDIVTILLPKVTRIFDFLFYFFHFIYKRNFKTTGFYTYLTMLFKQKLSVTDFF